MCNGKNEKLHLFLQTAMYAFVDKKHKNWDRYLPSALLAYRTAPLARIGFSPAFLVYGHEPNLPFDIIYGPKKLIKGDVLQHGTHLTEELRTAFDIVNQLRVQHNKKTKDRYDNPRPKKARYNPDLAVGSHVLLRIPLQTRGRSKKFLPRWDGPYTVVRRKLPQVYVIADKHGKEQTVNVKRLLSYTPWSHEKHSNDHPHHIFGNRPFGFLPHQRIPTRKTPPKPKPPPRPAPQATFSRTRSGRKRRQRPLMSDGIVRGFSIEILHEYDEMIMYENNYNDEAPTFDDDYINAYTVRSTRSISLKM
jgi:hypothetical protein